MLKRVMHLLTTLTLTGALATALVLAATPATAQAASPAATQAAPPEDTDTCVTWDGDVVDDSSPSCMHVYYTEDTLPCGPGDGCTNMGQPWTCRLLEPGPTERFVCRNGK